MVGLTRSGMGKLGLMGYPGHIFICKLRYGYGHQEYIEKLEILHSWYSDLNAFLPVMFKGKETEYTENKLYSFSDSPDKQSLSDLMANVGLKIDNLYMLYDPLFEGDSIDPKERTFIKAMRGIKELLDVITAESKIIEGIKTDETTELIAG